MYRLFATLCLVGCLVLAACARHQNADGSSETSVRTRGDAQIYGVYRSPWQPDQAD